MKKILGRFMACLVTVVLVIAVMSVIKNQFGISLISGDSMYPTLHNGKLFRFDTSPTKEEVKRGSIVIFKINGRGRDIIKRVVALPGEVISVSEQKLYINKEEIDATLSFGSISNAGMLSSPLLLSENTYFCIGDNYDNSYDSREFGPIQFDWITGIFLKEY